MLECKGPEAAKVTRERIETRSGLKLRIVATAVRRNVRWRERAKEKSEASGNPSMTKLQRWFIRPKDPTRERVFQNGAVKKIIYRNVESARRKREKRHKNESRFLTREANQLVATPLASQVPL